jgi:hypothetical protein
VNGNNSINVTSINININNNNSVSNSPRVNSPTARSTTVNSTNTIVNDSVTIPSININNNNNSVSNSPRVSTNANKSDTSNLKKENVPTKKKSRTWGLVNSHSIEDIVNEKTRKSKSEVDSSTGSRSQQTQQTRPRAASSFGQIDAR